MIVKALLPALAVLAPSIALAGPSLHQTHEAVAYPGRTVTAMRPVAHEPRAVKCHPEAGKAVGCEAQIALQRANAWANRRAPEKAELSRR